MICGRDVLDNNGAGCLQSDSGVTGHAGRTLFYDNGESNRADIVVCTNSRQTARVDQGTHRTFVSKARTSPIMGKIDR